MYLWAEVFNDLIKILQVRFEIFVWRFPIQLLWRHVDISTYDLQIVLMIASIALKFIALKNYLSHVSNTV